MLYDLVNPSDPVTFRADTFDAALCVTILVNGTGHVRGRQRRAGG